eukprot:scaffold21543_cov30-Tisochrysis_lutea.AAC.5
MTCVQERNVRRDESDADAPLHHAGGAGCPAVLLTLALALHMWIARCGRRRPATLCAIGQRAAQPRDGDVTDRA